MTANAAPTTTAAPVSPAEMVDLERYPILDLGRPAAREVVHWARLQLAETGACELPDFVRPAALAVLAAEARELARAAYRSQGRGTAYLEIPDAALPEEHPRRSFGDYAVGVVAYDQFPARSPLRRLYEWDPLMEFIGAALHRRPLHRYADPLGALNLAVMEQGDALQWHFDQTDFVVSLAIQAAESGGDFEVAPKIRSHSDERYDAVKRVLDGDRADVVTLPMRPGTLLLFEGRHSLHRVSRVRGATPRLVALLAYDTRPDTTSSEVLRMARYGRTG